MTQSLSRQSAEIIPFPGRTRAPVYGIDTRALEAEAAKYRSAVDTTGFAMPPVPSVEVARNAIVLV